MHALMKMEACQKLVLQMEKYALRVAHVKFLQQGCSSFTTVGHEWRLLAHAGGGSAGLSYQSGTNKRIEAVVRVVVPYATQ